jgi:hypothetical protein
MSPGMRSGVNWTSERHRQRIGHGFHHQRFRQAEFFTFERAMATRQQQKSDFVDGFLLSTITCQSPASVSAALRL